MPTYRYQCGNCKAQFELRQSFEDDPIATCPTCCGTARRLFLPVPILFKGPGFYVTDHRSNNSGNGSSSDSGNSNIDEVKKPAEAASDIVKEPGGES